MKSRTKLWLVILISIVSSFFLFIIFTIISGHIWNNGYDLNELNTISQETLDTIKQKNALTANEIKPILYEVHNQHPALRYEWISSDGSTIFDTSGDMQSYDFNQLAERFINMPNNLWTENGQVSLIYSINENEQSYYLLLSLPSEAMKPGQTFLFVRSLSVLSTLILPLILSFLLPYFLSLLFFSSMNRRISKLNNALGQVNIRKDLVVLNDNSKDEIGQLTQHYNSMAQRIQNQARHIEQFENKRKLLLSNLSHDLRTPLTAILGYAETIHDGLYRDENALQTSAKVILQRSLYINKLLDQLLDITRQDMDAFKLHLAPHNLSEMLEKIAEEYLLLLVDQHFTVEVDIANEDTEVIMDASLVERAIRNLLDNAIRYGKEGHYLAIGLIEKEDEVWITVKDMGKGISEENQELIFERFYRVNEEASAEGLGIGLSIVKEIVELHKGNIQISSIPFQETVFLIKLPKK